MGMIRVSDEVEEQLKAISDGRSMSATVKMLLENQDIKDSAHIDAKYIKLHIDEVLRARFDELKALIEDTTIDRVERPRGARMSKTFLDWEITKEIFYEVMRDGGPEWFSEQTKFAIENLDTSLDCYIENDTLCSDDAYGTKRVILSISPRIKEFLKSKGIDI